MASKTKKSRVESKTVLREKAYTVKLVEYSDGSSLMNRRNDGFSSIELLGFLEFAQQEILEQIHGRIKPDIVKREVVETKKP